MRTLPPGSSVLVYDFQVFLDDLMKTLRVGYSVQKFDYNFKENLNDWREFSSETVNTDNIELHLSVQQAVHILLANSYRYQLFQKRFNNIDPFDYLIEYIQKQNIEPELKAEIYFTRHRIL